MQNVYEKVMRDNKADAAAMSKDTHAILKHYSSTPEKPHHETAPRKKARCALVLPTLCPPIDRTNKI